MGFRACLNRADSLSGWHSQYDRADVTQRGSNVRQQIESDLKLELNAVAMHNRFVQLAGDEGDNASRELCERYLSQQIRDEKGDQIRPARQAERASAFARLNSAFMYANP